MPRRGSGLGSLFSGLGSLFGFANGGSFGVGGSGGIDSQLVAFRASPNETVSVTKPGQDLGGSGGNLVQQFSIDARGAQQGVGEEIRRALADFEKRYDRALPSKIVMGRQMNRGRF